MDQSVKLLTKSVKDAPGQTVFSQPFYKFIYQFKLIYGVIHLRST